LKLVESASSSISSWRQSSIAKQGFRNTDLPQSQTPFHFTALPYFPVYWYKIVLIIEHNKCFINVGFWINVQYYAGQKNYCKQTYNRQNILHALRFMQNKIY
jgi:hypothetical protein